MSDLAHTRRNSAVPWDRKIPETVLALYLDFVRSFPTWRLMCPHYIHPDVKDATELGYNSSTLRTAYGEYVFTFSMKSTFIYEIEEEVRTGQLEVRCNNEPVLNVGVSCADGENSKPEWVARNVEVFCDGEWVNDLLELAVKQKAHEHQRLQVEKTERQRHAQELTSLRKRFGVEERPDTSKRAANDDSRPGWRLRFWKKSGR